MKIILNEIGYSLMAQGALVLFCIAFVLLCYGTLRLSRRASDRFASIPLSDRVEDPRHE